MRLKELLLNNRSRRRFVQSEIIRKEDLVQWVDLSRLTPSSHNAQPLKYFISDTPELNAKIFPSLAWAGALKDWNGPEEGERPSAYIVMLLDKKISQSPQSDDGIAALSIMLGATEAGYGGCIVRAVNRKALRETLSLPEDLEIVLVLALGKTNETVILEPMQNNDFKYWRDKKECHHVPKRSLEEIIIN